MDGVLLVDKPAGPTSHDVVAVVRRALGVRRVGHAGTLDPFATGLMLMLVGRATRIQRHLMGLPKRYQAVARLGAVSSTGDPEGEVVLTGRMPERGVTLAPGWITQRPPAFSAVRVDGERAYRRARRGERFEVPERRVRIDEFRETWREAERAGFEIACSSGTYVRSLIAGLGDAYCLSLRRTAIGPFRVEDAVGPEEAGPGVALVGLERALSFLPSVRLAGEAARRAAHGARVAAPAGVGEGEVLLLDDDGVVAIARVRAGPRGPELAPSVGMRTG